jgi:mono/diheme cytochrome c family protein
MMRKSSKLLASAILACFTSLPAMAEDGDTELGAELYGEFCSNCHGQNAEGLSAFKDDADQFFERIDEGFTENMPDFAGVFEAEEISAIYAYLKQATGE